MVKYNIGDIVWLKSGSPAMTVTSPDNSGVLIADSQITEVEWFDGAKLNREAFLTECLTNKET